MSIRLQDLSVSFKSSRIRLLAYQVLNKYVRCQNLNRLNWDETPGDDISYSTYHFSMQFIPMHSQDKQLLFPGNI